MKESILFCTFTLGTFAFFFGCQYTPEPVPTGQGVIQGNVVLADTNGGPAPNNGVRISLEGTPFFTLSDIFGKWTLKNIPHGKYTISFSKVGFASWKFFDVKINAEGTNYFYDDSTTDPLGLWALPNITLDLTLRGFEATAEIQIHDSVMIDSLGHSHKITIRDTIWDKSALYSSNVSFGSVFPYIYFSKSNNIDPLDANTFLYFISNEISSYPGHTEASLNITKSALLKAGFSSADKIYCCAYAGSETSLYAGWYDPVTGRTIKSGMSPHHSEVKSFILP